MKLLTLFGVCLFISCGTKETKEAPPTVIGGDLEKGKSASLRGTFECGAAQNICNTETEYCLKSEIFSSKLELTAECKRLPEGCTAYSKCIVQDGKEHFASSKNCSFGTYYRASNGQYSLTCYSS